MSNKTKGSSKYAQDPTFLVEKSGRETVDVVKGILFY